ncbi:MAG TPA: helix-turn-helix transcriptional regulator [Conexibacter sp.]|jgi:transcriptional regulator with XRE-family HTH domain|nr:helix-turn-helix transcriptional regulator [Conexibacter sp.]
MPQAADQIDQLGRAVRAVRRERELSQEALAASSGIHPNQVGRLERGVNVQVGTLLAVVDGLGVGLAELGRMYDCRTG